MFWGMAFNHKQCHQWPSLKAKQEIPVGLRHPLSLAKEAKPSVVGLGLVSGICKLLLGEVSLGKAERHLSVTYSSSNGDSRVVSSELADPKDTTKRVWLQTTGTHALTLLAVAEGVVFDTLPDVVLTWHDLLNVLYLTLGKRPPYSERQLLTASFDTLCTDTMMRLTDTIYRTVSQAVKKGNLDDADDTAMAYPTLSLETLYAQTAPQDLGASEHSVKETLVDLIFAGGTALLLGPTGTLKTETAKAACLESKVALVVIKGRVGLEDRDFYGGIYPVGRSVKFVDGPLTRAFRSAQEQKTALLVDELLRLEPHYLNAFIGVLDSYTPQELCAMGLKPLTQERHYLLEVPTGESLVAPCSQLSVIATSNLGGDYLQAQNIDAALLGRFALQIDMLYLAQTELQTFYQAQIGDTKLAEALVTLELFTRESTTETHGLLARAANSRVMLNAAGEYQRQLARGRVKGSAFTKALGLTLVPFCVPRTGSGGLEECAKLRLCLEIEKVGRTL
jgi:MoxR-like ATPase